MKWPDNKPTEHDPTDPRMSDDCNTARIYDRDLRDRRRPTPPQDDHVNMRIAKAHGS